MSKLALVVDGTTELGQATCIKLGSLGYQVVTVYFNDDARMHQLQTVMQIQGSKMQAYSSDAADKNAILRCLQEITIHSGPLNILVNCTGIRCDTARSSRDRNDVDTAAGLYLDSIADITRMVRDSMAEKGGGRIVNIYSICMQKDIYDQFDFSDTRNKLVDFTHSLSLETHYTGITINMISADCMPPQTSLSFSGLKLESAAGLKAQRLTKAEEVAGLAAYLVSDEAGFLSGANISVR